MENIFEDVSDYIVVINENKIIKFCNIKFAEKLNYKKENYKYYIFIENS